MYGQEKVVPVPQVSIEEVVRQVPVPMMQEVVREVPSVQIQEVVRTIPAPQPMMMQAPSYVQQPQMVTMAAPTTYRQTGMGAFAGASMIGGGCNKKEGLYHAWSWYFYGATIFRSHGRCNARNCCSSRYLSLLRIFHFGTSCI